ncbi:hypothetical protein XENOCAPTIV_024860, partial [Xenoophorus captivus]
SRMIHRSGEGNVTSGPVGVRRASVRVRKRRTNCLKKKKSLTVPGSSLPLSEAFVVPEMEDGSELMEDVVFRGVEFSVKMELDKNLLIVEISDSVTADQWRGEFDPALKEEKEAMAMALERLQMSGSGSALGREDWRIRDVVRTLEEQLVKERAKSQRSTSKRVSPVSGHIGSRIDGEVYRSLSRERRSGYGGVMARSGSRERMEDRRLRSGERGRRADSSGPRPHIPRPSPSPTGMSKIEFPSSERITSVEFMNTFFCFPRQRKVRRDILSSPVLPERGRSRSREAYPQVVRAGSRDRSLSMERRGSRNSSESSLADMDEMTKTLLRYCDYKGSIDTGAELSEIDARLQALQEYMRDLDTGH